MANALPQDAGLPRWVPGVIAVLAAATALTGFHPVYEVDAFFQMQLGRAVVHSGSRLVPEPSAIAAFSDPCLAFEWLWGVLLLGVTGIAGPAGLTMLTMVLAVAAVATTFAYLRTRGLGRHPTALVALSALSAVAIASRVKARPQVLFMVLIPGLLWLIARVLQPPPDAGGQGDADDPAWSRRRGPAIALCAAVVVWAQLHGSFILVPGIFGALAIQSYIDDGLTRARVRADALIVLGLMLAMLTSAAGLDLVAYVLAHGGGDAVAHIREMAPMDFSTFSPFDQAHHLAFFVVWGISLCGLTRDGKPRVGELLLALLGVVLLSRAGRFVGAATLLALPLASIGALNLSQLCTAPIHLKLRPAVLWLSVLGALLALGSSARTQAITRGPLGVMGWTAGAHPLAALRALDPGPNSAGRRREILTDYRAGPALAFWSHGRIRHYVDGRTPQYFDDTDYAVQRELFRDEGALLRGIARYAPSGAVVRRTGSCIGFAAHWDLIAIDAMYSTFVPRQGAEPAPGTLHGIAPCGERYLAPDACAAGGAHTLASLGRIDDLSEPALAAHVRAAFELRCRSNPAPALALGRGAETWGHRVALRRLQAQAAVAAGKAALSRELIDEGLDERDAGIVQGLPPRFALVTGAAFARDAIARAADIMDDDTPAQLRAMLALLCIDAGDLECARFHGMRAATHGEPGAAAVMRHLMDKHPRAQVRADAAKWLEVLVDEAQPAR